jgi:hypothetical protein
MIFDYLAKLIGWRFGFQEKGHAQSEPAADRMRHLVIDALSHCWKLSLSVKRSVVHFVDWDKTADIRSLAAYSRNRQAGGRDEADLRKPRHAVISPMSGQYFQRFAITTDWIAQLMPSLPTVKHQHRRKPVTTCL